MKKRFAKKVISVVLCTFICVGNAGCDSNGDSILNTGSGDDVNSSSRDVFAMDTYMTVTAYGNNCGEAVDEAIDEINRIDDLLSVGDTDSEVYKLNEQGSAIVSQDTKELLKASLDLYEKTNGAYDITIYPLMVKWGFTSGSYKVPDKEDVEEILKYVDAGKIEFDDENDKITLSDGVQIDFGGIAKGYTSQRIMEIFEDYEVECGIVSLGGNVEVYRGKYDGNLWKIAVEDPKDTSQYIGVVQVEDKAVITSGGYERYFEEDGKEYHHILDPKTGYPADAGLSSVTIVSEDGMYADGLSTAVFVMGKEEAVKLWKQSVYNFEMILVTDEGDIFITSGLTDSFTSDYNYNVIE